MLINLTLGATALVFAGDSLGRGLRIKHPGIFVFGCLELIVGLYFITAAIGAA
jgi:hypothetical protein